MSAFNDFIDNHIDVSEVDGITCKTIHPLIDDALKNIADCKSDDPASAFLTDTLQQLVACATSEVQMFLSQELTSIDVGGETTFVLKAHELQMLIRHSMQVVLASRAHIAKHSSFEV